MWPNPTPWVFPLGFSTFPNMGMGNGAHWMRLLDVVRFGPYSATRVRPVSSGVIGIATSRCLGTASSERLPQVKRSESTFADYSYQRSQQSKGDKTIRLGTERKLRGSEFNQKMTSDMDNTRTTSEALAALKNRLQQGITVGVTYMYVDILRRCSRQKDLLATKQVHDFIIESGMDKNLYVGTALLSVYIKCGKLLDARRVFDELEKKDVVTWNMMLAAYAKSNNLDEARLVFDRMEKRDVVTWTTMIGALAKHGCGHEAYRLFLQMRREGFKPDAITYLSILNPSASSGALEWVKEVHGHAQKAGLVSDLRVGNALVRSYAKSGSIDDARLDFGRMEARDVSTWTGLIGGLAKHGCGHGAYHPFPKMEGLEPDAITYLSSLNASASAASLGRVKESHGHTTKAGLKSDVRVGNALVHMYAKSGSIDDARLVFDRMEKRDVVTWTALIGGLAQHGQAHEALELFRKMNEARVKPDRTTFMAVLLACCYAGLVDDGRRLFLAMTQDYGIQPDIGHYNCMVDLLGRAGHLEEATLFINDMPVEPNGVTWKALLGACRTYGNVELGELAFKEVLKWEPNTSPGYVLLSNIYAAAGKWEKVSLVRNMMQERGVRKEPGYTWIEVDNEIHKFVVGDTSHPEAKAIHAYIKELTEKLKAEGYIPDTQLVLQHIDEEDKELVLCSHSEKLAIAYGLMRIPRGSPIRVEKNLRVCTDCHTATKFISKVTGREIIARDAIRFHHFKDGVCSCGDYW